MKLLLRRFDKTVQRGVNRHLMRFYLLRLFMLFTKFFDKVNT